MTVIFLADTRSRTICCHRQYDRVLEFRGGIANALKELINPVPGELITRGIGANWEHTALARLSKRFEPAILHQKFWRSYNE